MCLVLVLFLFSAVIMLEHTSMYFGGVPSICEDDTSLYPDFYSAGYVYEMFYLLQLQLRHFHHKNYRSIITVVRLISESVVLMESLVFSVFLIQHLWCNLGQV